MERKALDGATAPPSVRRPAATVSATAETCNMLNKMFCSQEVFADAGDEVSHVVSIIEQRCKERLDGELQEDDSGSSVSPLSSTSAAQLGDDENKDDASAAQLRFLCERYVTRYQRRMEMLKKYGGASAKVQNTSNRWTKLKNFLEKPFESIPSIIFFLFLSLLVCASCAAVFAGTIPEYNPRVFPRWEPIWFAFDISATVFFAIEFIVRCLASTLDNSTHKPWHKNFIKFWKSPSNVVDFFAVVLPAPAQLLGKDYHFFNMFRMMRLFRAVFTLRHFDPFEDLELTLVNSISSLSGPLIGLLLVLLASASIMYTLESGSWTPSTGRFMVRNEDCEASAPAVLGRIECVRNESKFISAVHAMWFVLVTFLTVGYGDLVPLTQQGRAFGAVIIVAGSLFMAMPIAIIGTNFTLAVAYLREERRAVRVLMSRRTLLSDERKNKVDRALFRPAALPSLAFCRYLRLCLGTNVLDLHCVTKRASYYIDNYLQKVAQQFLNHPEFIEKIVGRQRMERKPYLPKFVLLRRERGGSGGGPLVQHDQSISLRVPKSLSIGTDPSCDLQLLYSREVIHRLWEALDKTQEYHGSLQSRLLAKSSSRLERMQTEDSILHFFQRDPAGESTGLVLPASSCSGQSADYGNAGDCAQGQQQQEMSHITHGPLISSHHATLSFLNYVGSQDRLQLVGVPPHNTFVCSRKYGVRQVGGDDSATRTGKSQATAELSGVGEPTILCFHPAHAEHVDWSNFSPPGSTSVSGGANSHYLLPNAVAAGVEEQGEEGEGRMEYDRLNSACDAPLFVALEQGFYFRVVSPR